MLGFDNVQKLIKPNSNIRCSVRLQLYAQTNHKVAKMTHQIESTYQLKELSQTQKYLIALMIHENNVLKGQISFSLQRSISMTSQANNVQNCHLGKQCNLIGRYPITNKPKGIYKLAERVQHFSTTLIYRKNHVSLVGTILTIIN